MQKRVMLNITRMIFKIAVMIIPFQLTAQNIVKLDAKEYPGSKKDNSMWSGIYTAKSGKIYVGLCTHADAANFYEYDPGTGRFDHIADLTIFKGERGQGIRTSGKIHVTFVEDREGNIYFGDFCEDNGPEAIDPSSYRGAHWFKYDPRKKELKNIGLISRHSGLLGMAIDAGRSRLYGLGEDGHLYMFDMKKRLTIDKGRVDDWDICRTIVADDQGNVYGSFPVNRIWKYVPDDDTTYDLQNLYVPNDPRVSPRTMSNPQIDRKTLWRILEWKPDERVFYGITNSDSRLFRFDPNDGEEGKIEPMVLMCADRYLDGDPKKIPIATLAFAIAGNDKIYYAPVTVGFDYAAESWDVKDERNFTARITKERQPPRSILIEYNLKTKQRREIGLMETSDGRIIYGLGGAVYSPIDKKLYFAGAVEEKDPSKVAGEIDGTWHYSMALFSLSLPE